jgi:hypothetical protein
MPPPGGPPIGEAGRKLGEADSAGTTRPGEGIAELVIPPARIML